MFTFVHTADKNILNQPNLIFWSKLVSPPGQADLFAGFRLVLGTFQLVKLGYQLFGKII